MFLEGCTEKVITVNEFRYKDFDSVLGVREKSLSRKISATKRVLHRVFTIFSYNLDLGLWPNGFPNKKV